MVFLTRQPSGRCRVELVTSLVRFGWGLRPKKRSTSVEEKLEVAWANRPGRTSWRLSRSVKATSVATSA
jgi:hypothetical protein